MYKWVKIKIHQNIYQISYATNQNRIKAKITILFIFLDHFVTDSSKSEGINKNGGWRDVVVATWRKREEYVVGGGKEPTLEVEEMTSSDNDRRENGDSDKTISNSSGDYNRIKVNEEEKQEKMNELDMMLHNLGYKITQGGTDH